jgi:hypothetical protein
MKRTLKNLSTFDPIYHKQQILENLQVGDVVLGADTLRYLEGG